MKYKDSGVDIDKASKAAVNIAIAKRRGANAVTVAGDLRERLDALAGSVFPDGVAFEVTRDYGATANQKISDLIASLGVAIVIVVALIGITLGWRAALVVALAVPVCYGITLILDFAAGYTINRVTLFALILALGLLVDDPITGVDNIERHLGRGSDAAKSVIDAILEIRNPLIIACTSGIILNYSGIGLHAVLEETFSIFGRAALPVGLLCVGAAVDVAAARNSGKIVAFSSVLKLIVFPLLMWSLCILLRLDHQLSAIAILFAALPGSPAAYILSRQLGGDSSLIAGIITVQIVAAMVTFPLVMALLAMS